MTSRAETTFDVLIDISSSSSQSSHDPSNARGPAWRAFRCDLDENAYPRLNLHWLLKLQWLAAASDRLTAHSQGEI